MEPPLIILAPPKSFASVISAMLGQHPGICSVGDLNLFAGQSLRELAVMYSFTNPRQQDGLLRAIAEVFLKRQTEKTISVARLWVAKNGRMPTVDLFRKIAERVAPRILVEKSAWTAWRPNNLQRVKEQFPDARYLHLVRHPRSHGRAVIETLEREAHFRQAVLDKSKYPPVIDPQILWFRFHDTIDRFLASIPAERQYCARGEDVLLEPDLQLGEIARWLGLDSTAEIIQNMKHPERSPYATLGPLNAPFGNNSEFLKEPTLQARFATSESLDGPLEWRDGSTGFASNVKARAERFGYR